MTPACPTETAMTPKHLLFADRFEAALAWTLTDHPSPSLSLPGSISQDDLNLICELINRLNNHHIPEHIDIPAIGNYMGEILRCVDQAPEHLKEPLTRPESNAEHHLSHLKLWNGLQPPNPGPGFFNCLYRRVPQLSPPQE